MIACVNVPYFAATVEQRDDPALAEISLIVGGQPWEPRPLYAFSREVAKKGVRAGMSLRLAHVLSPQARFIPATPPKYHTSSGEIVDVLIDFTHLIEPENLWQLGSHPPQVLDAAAQTLPACYYVDLEYLPLREATPLMREVGRTVRHHTYLGPSIGLAASKFTARVAAALARPHHVRPIAEDEEQQFLAERSVAFLPLDKETRRRLHMLGIRTLGQFTALPLPALQAQFGMEIVSLYRLARGEVIQVVQPRAEKKRETVTYHFDPPLDNEQTLQATVQRAAQELARRLQQARMAARQIQLKWETEDDEQPHVAAPMVLRAFTADPEWLFSSLQAMIRRSSLTSGITTIIASVEDIAPAVARQLPLFTHTHSHTQMNVLVQQTLQNAIARHKTAGFYQATIADRYHPLPECRFQLHPLPETYVPIPE
jgi:nucleotidyltransferase/DNA polymerase involved in DNA repair